MQESFSLLIWGFIHQEEPDFEAAEEVLESMQQTELRWECREAWVSTPPAVSLALVAIDGLAATVVNDSFVPLSTAPLFRLSPL